LAALEVVDYVVIFDEDSPYDLIKSIKPHILVKGGDCQEKKVVGQDIADELKLVQFVDGKSTTKTIGKIKQALNFLLIVVISSRVLICLSLVD